VPLGAPTPLPIVVTPPSLTLAPGEAAHVAVHAPQGGAFGILSDRCAGIAVPVVLPDALKVSGLAPGRCSVTLTAASGVTVRVPIEVGAEPGPLAIEGAKMPIALSRAAAILAHGTSVTIHVSQGAYAGPFSIAGNCKGIAAITGLGNWLTVVALDAGTCSAQVVGLAGRKSALAITVEPSPEVRP
jgi:hypothetical protein